VAEERTIVYGLGRMFAKQYAQIHEKYYVVGYCDADSSKRARFANGLAPEELAGKAASYDALLVTPRQGFEIASMLVKKYGVDGSKIRLLSKPLPRPPVEGKRDPFLPDVVTHGKYAEDMAILYLCRTLGLENRRLRYWEAGVPHFPKGSATYCLYRKGARGLLFLNPYAEWDKQAKVYRAEDSILELATATASVVLERQDRPDVLSLHEVCSTEEWLEVVYAKQPQILTVIARDSSRILKILSHGYTLFTNLQGECAVFYRRGKEA